MTGSASGVSPCSGAPGDMGWPQLGRTQSQTEMPTQGMRSRGSLGQGPRRARSADTGRCAGAAHLILAWLPDLGGSRLPVQLEPLPRLPVGRAPLLPGQSVPRAPSARVRLRRLTFETDIEGYVASKGDVIRVTHDLTVWGYSGRMMPGSSSGSGGLPKIVLDSAVFVSQTTKCGSVRLGPIPGRLAPRRI